MDIAANLSSAQNSMFAEDDEDNDEDVWGMPKYQQNYSLENLTDEQYLARVSILSIIFFYVLLLFSDNFHNPGMVNH